VHGVHTKFKNEKDKLEAHKAANIVR